MPAASERTFKAARKRTTTAIKTKILSALQKIETAGDFACFDRVSPSVSPGLHINGLGLVKLPLSQADAAAIIDVCHRSPFGQGTETLVTSVRKCWELDAKRYKFLLYEPGAFFLPHQDSPKANGIFGTLVVCLPSKHDGGEVVVTRQGESRIFESAATSGSSTSFAAWYSDVIHEIKPVKSGYRMVITYNLIHDGPGDTPSFVLVDPDLETAMKGWISEAESGRGLAPEFLLYMLSHEYPTSGLKFESMKGKDDSHVAQLRSVCKVLDTTLYLGTVERQVDGGCDEYDDFPIGTENCDTGDFIQDNAVTGAPDSENYSGYTGNEGVSATHFYRRTVAVIVPRISRVKFLFKRMLPPKPGMSEWIDRLLCLLSDPKNTDARSEFETIANLVFYHNNKMKRIERPVYFQGDDTLVPFADAILCKVAEGLSRIENMDLCERVIDHLSNPLLPPFMEIISKSFCNQACKEGIRLLDTILKKTGSTISLRAMAIPMIANACLEHLGNDIMEKKKELEEWQRTNIESSLSLITSARREGTKHLVWVMTLYPDDRMKSKVNAVLMSFITQPSFISTFLTNLCQNNTGKQVEKCISPFYEDLLAKMVPYLKIGEHRSTMTSKGPFFEHRITERLNDCDLLNIVCQCRLLKISAMPLYDGLRKAVTNAKNGEKGSHALIFPFLKRMISWCLIDMDSPDEECVRFATDFLRLYLELYVKKEPSRMDFTDTDLCTCCCESCQEMNAFLQSPSPRTTRILDSGSKMGHLKNHHKHGLEIKLMKSGDSHFLGITKTSNAHLEWEKRANLAKQMISSLGVRSDVERILGANFYEHIISLIAVQSGEQTLSPIIDRKGKLKIELKIAILLNCPSLTCFCRPGNV
ncbi:hypothetical protein LOZ03_003062 [Ophidiomyces ophidiicola]|nr:hypothetical protein LOZ26_004043 [Ophidiomyces ophidiicola]KAI2182667.1 hypothetical protein LOZ22_003284 [Ophidiomyces ophidiicola]KAI2292025.1 hypothetical protein LOZ03_003062 [Ophidiomyces ophidiicola]KAI2304574.1 hypothetical protein LOY99_004604 [Ophidiomyces ophidiicola]KAI2366968.1 hypothetical protein LOY93_003741 [Ophidiomyces ophidiicola]